MREALGMSWAEFVLRSIAFREEREFQMLMTREISYQSYCSQFAFSKKKPVKKQKFWPIGVVEETSKVTKNQRKAFLDAFKKYKKESNG